MYLQPINDRKVAGIVSDFAGTSSILTAWLLFEFDMAFQKFRIQLTDQ